MTLSDFKELLLQEHKRDKKLTFINYALISVGIIAIVALLFYLGANFSGIAKNFTGAMDSASGSYSTYYKFVIPLVVICCICYPFYQIYKLQQRPKKIEDLINKIQKGAKATTIQDVVSYKITLPLLKVNLKLCPVTMVYIYLNDDVKPFILPLNKFYLSDAKLLLSGADIQQLNTIKDALYGDTDPEAQNTVATPLKSVDEFKEFIKTDLMDTISDVESNRKSTRSTMIIMGVIATLLAFGFVGYMAYNAMQTSKAGNYSSMGSDPIKTFLPFIAIFLVIYVGYYIYSKSKSKGQADTATGGYESIQTTFKTKIFDKMVKFINPSVEYSPLGHIGLPEFLESGFFVEKNYDIDGSDQISGRHNGVPFLMCDLSVSYRRNFSDEKEGPDSVFFGQFFVARFNKSFSSSVYLIPKKKFFAGSNDIGGYTSPSGEKVLLEDPEFMDMFNVYAEDQVEARYILTTAMMERIKQLTKRTKGQYHIVFNNNKITVANNSRTDNFEVGYSKSLTKNDNELLVNFYKDLADQFAIIDELRLNVRIWG
ncbi:DUF3137 domain-containing protein [Dysgonomonas sp. 520]|uniref:DUF3137 domain-containing protein n=1 Tax=Dysgonomonas sp. 520 TaxID=2302931 RepID=UPI0013D33BF4|nr:DUF3137 domain-containing protein [Dysgonomonas sp. 520]